MEDLQRDSDQGQVGAGLQDGQQKMDREQVQGKRRSGHKVQMPQAGEGKPELVDDWDQRLVVTTLTAPENGRLVLNQVAEKDQVGETRWQQVNFHIADAL